MNHLELDTLLAMEEATGWSAAAVMGHVAVCTECRRTLEQLEQVGSLRAEIEPDAGFTARIMAAMAVARSADAASPPHRAPRWPPTFSSTVFAAASVCAWLLVHVPTQGQPRPVTPGTGILIAAVAGLAAAWHAARLQPSIITRRAL
jgi:hypothetical protein